MKVTIKKKQNEVKEVKFSKIKVGEIFSWGDQDRVFIRTKPSNEGYSQNVLELTGKSDNLVNFYVDDLVYRTKNVELVVGEIVK